MTDKQLYCIRHGESQFNEWRTRSLWTFSWIYERDPMILDPRLSAKGEQQVAKLYELIQSKNLHEKVEVIVVSPLTRAIQTAAGGFKDATIPYQVEPSCREYLDTSSDIGRAADEISRDFQALSLDVSALEEYWWVRPHLRVDETIVKVPKTYQEVLRLRETSAQLDERIKEFITKLVSMPQQHIAVVGHSHFFKKMLGMSRKLANCELAVVSLDEVAKRHGVALNAVPTDATSSAASD
ncbi:hypothetical protein Poli38472_004165 [Pythium oligandrum]|uniref:Phosphoglycerate mutase n=1 Tax=Pythium oligandrum TaxID=41045 RepID=A0A8K1CN60_PYTOL|nr:hypothetical protein Poli38472_004165 [Pythium oligandrum]|eukprot:TMW66400.1 hypothetical protein Poli38472_004165 [Pythium oligandrum]